MEVGWDVGTSQETQGKAVASPVLLTRDRAMVSAAQGDWEMAFPHLKPAGLGRLPEWGAREAPRQDRSLSEEGSSGSSHQPVCDQQALGHGSPLRSREM